MVMVVHDRRRCILQHHNLLLKFYLLLFLFFDQCHHLIMFLLRYIIGLFPLLIKSNLFIFLLLINIILGFFMFSLKLLKCCLCFLFCYRKKLLVFFLYFLSLCDLGLGFFECFTKLGYVGLLTNQEFVKALQTIRSLTVMVNKCILKVELEPTLSQYRRHLLLNQRLLFQPECASKLINLCYH